MTRYHCILMFIFLACPVEPSHAVLHIQNIAEKENINVEMLFTSKMKVVHTERIFIAFSRGTSIIVALESHTRYTKPCKINVSSTLKNT